jgi:alpha-D-xyloside xylohydrolase
MVQELQDLGVETAVTFWPYVTPSGSYFNPFTAQGFFATNLTGGPIAVETWAGQMHLVDETNPAARSAYYKAFRDGYGKFGIRTVWLDGSEPERGTSYNFGQLRLAGGTDSEVGEAWIQQHVRAMAEGFADDGFAPNEFFLLPRSAWAGTSRYSAGVWSGDIESTFAELALQVRVAQQMALSGHALWTNDGGGYGGGDPADPVFQELVVRWLQASAFFPIMRLHGQRRGGPAADECGSTGGDNEPWTLARDAAHYSAIAAAMQLRAELREYTLTINRVTVSTGLPMLRPMVLAYPGDAGCAGVDVEDQWLYGPDFLVGPVLVQGATSRSVYLPALINATWVYRWNGTDAGSGGHRVTVDTTSLSDFPLFVRTPA